MPCRPPRPRSWRRSGPPPRCKPDSCARASSWPFAHYRRATWCWGSSAPRAGSAHLVGGVATGLGSRSVQRITKRLTKKAFVIGSQNRVPTKYAHLVEKGRKEVKPTKKQVLYSGVTGTIYGRRAKSVPARPFVLRTFQATRTQSKQALEAEHGAACQCVTRCLPRCEHARINPTTNGETRWNPTPPTPRRRRCPPAVPPADDKRNSTAETTAQTDTTALQFNDLTSVEFASVTLNVKDIKYGEARKSIQVTGNSNANHVAVAGKLKLTETLSCIGVPGADHRHDRADGHLGRRRRHRLDRQRGAALAQAGRLDRRRAGHGSRI